MKPVRSSMSGDDTRESGREVGGLGALVDPLEAGRVRAALLRRLFDDAPAQPRLGRFEIVRRIGAGAMGVVYLARDPDLERDVALKLVRCDVAGMRADARAIARLRTEARAMARVTHPHVVPVHEVGVLDDGVFIVMEHVAGGTLRAWLGERTRTIAEIVRVFLAAGQGLAAVHRAGLVHRDFKP